VNVPGASGIKGRNYVIEWPRDGSVITNVSLASRSTSDGRAQGGPRPICATSTGWDAERDQPITVMWHGSPVQTLAQAKQPSPCSGAATPESTGAMLPRGV